MVASAALLRSPSPPFRLRSLSRSAPAAGAPAPVQTASQREALHDAELVRRFNGGEESAFVEITGRHRSRLFAVGYAMLKNHADAEEVAQDALVRAYRGLVRFRGDSSLATWLHRIALNLARTRYRHGSRRHQHLTTSFEGLVHDGSPITLAEVLASSAEGPTRDVETAEFLAHVAHGLTQLEARPREILALLHQADLSYLEIAHQLGISLGTVKSRIARARRNLQQFLRNECTEFGPQSVLSDWFEPRRTASAGP